MHSWTGTRLDDMLFAVEQQLAKLEEVRQRREQQRLQRIEREGFDRFTPAKPGENRPAAVRDSRQEESSSSDED